MLQAKDVKLMKIIRILILAGLVLGAAVAQTPPERLEFDAVSIKPAEGFIEGMAESGKSRTDGAQIHLDRYAAIDLITGAYGVKAISGDRARLVVRPAIQCRRQVARRHKPGPGSRNAQIPIG